MKDFVDALRFLTRVPMPAAAGVPGFGARAFPLVGLLLGATAVAIDALLGAVDPGVRNVAILAAGAVLTGAIHYDGLADVLDAAGAATREERLRIMRDGTVGVFAVLGLIFVVAAELAALSALHGDIRWRALLLAPVVGRAAMVLSAFEAPSARAEGLGTEFVRALRTSDVIVASATALLLLVVVGRGSGFFAGLIAAATSFTLRRMTTAALGGVTGDVIGASGKIAEVVLLVVFAA